MKLAAQLNWRSRASSLFLGLAVVALAFRLLIPPGYMPSFGGEKNVIALEFCSVHTEQQIVLIDLATGERISPEDASGAPGEKDGKKKSQQCAFASASGATALAPGATSDFIAVSPLEENPRPEASFAIASTIAHLPWGTGPPRAAM